MVGTNLSTVVSRLLRAFPERRVALFPADGEVTADESSSRHPHRKRGLRAPLLAAIEMSTIE